MYAFDPRRVWNRNLDHKRVNVTKAVLSDGALIQDVVSFFSDYFDSSHFAEAVSHFLGEPAGDGEGVGEICC